MRRAHTIARVVPTLLIISVLSFSIKPATADFHRGDLVPASRRAQFHGSRTTWHDLFARHCPTFGVDAVVAVPLPKPLSFRDNDEYKLQLSFDHDRHVTRWVTVLDKATRDEYALHLKGVADRQRKSDTRIKGSNKKGLKGDNGDSETSSFDFEKDFDRYPPFVPMIDYQLVRGDGGVIKRTDIKVVPISPNYLKTHREYVRNFHNSSDWPKHVLVRYTWDTEVEVDSEGFLSVSLLVFVVCVFFVVRGILEEYGSAGNKFLDGLYAHTEQGGSGRNMDSSTITISTGTRNKCE